MMPRTRLVLGLCGLAMAAPALPAVASPADYPQAGYAAPAPQPSAGTQPAIGLERRRTRRLRAFRGSRGIRGDVRV